MTSAWIFWWQLLWLIASTEAVRAVDHEHYSSSKCGSWSYLGANGMASWPTWCPSCNGKFQSPIDIPVNSLETPPSSMNLNVQIDVQVPPNTPPFQLKNDGHGLTLKVSNIRITGAGLPKTYIVDNFHWHWGSSASSGSEHTVGDLAYPMEGHMVTYNADYANLSVALDNPGNVAVFGVLYHDSKTDNTLFSTLLQNISRIAEPYQTTLINALSIDFASLLPEDKYPFYRYSGSLTTPDCTEGLTWTVFGNTVPISSYQINLLRTNLTYDEPKGQKMVNNSRSRQQLGGRPVYVVRGSGARTASFSGILIYVPLFSYTIWLLATDASAVGL